MVRVRTGAQLVRVAGEAFNGDVGRRADRHDALQWIPAVVLGAVVLLDVERLDRAAAGGKREVEFRGGRRGGDPQTHRGGVVGVDGGPQPRPRGRLAGV